jgi:RNA polymerase sigma-70 factor (ECF subfamily)
MSIVSTSTVKEQELIRLLQAKEKMGFDLLYDKYGKCLYLVILKIVQDQEIAGEVLQDSFINIWQQASSYDSSKGSLLSWLLSIIRHTAHARMRSIAY